MRVSLDEKGWGVPLFSKEALLSRSTSFIRQGESLFYERSTCFKKHFSHKTGTLPRTEAAVASL